MLDIDMKVLYLKTKLKFNLFNRLLYLGNKYQCPVCLSRIAKFTKAPNWWIQKLKKYNHTYSLNDYETLNLENNCCPVCKVGDTNRLCAIYIRRLFARLNIDKKYLFIDFAPVPPLAKLIRSYPLEYRSADLLMPDVDDHVDIMDMKIYKDKTVDFFLCSHVLEHVTDDLKAMGELYRILKPGGLGIVMVPIMLAIKDVHEDSKFTKESDRWKYFGQGDHVRIYSKNGFVQRLAKVGFKIEQLGVDYFKKDVFYRHGISQKSILYIATK